jgi:hypothetical protein
MSQSPDTTHLDGPDPFAEPPAPLAPVDRPFDAKALALRAYAIAHSTHPDLLDEHDAEHTEVRELAELFDDVAHLAAGRGFDEGVEACADDDHGQHPQSSGTFNTYPVALRRTRSLRLDGVAIVHRVTDPADRYSRGAVAVLLPGHGHPAELVIDRFVFHRLAHLPHDAAPVETTLVHDPKSAPTGSWSTGDGGSWRAPRDGETGQPVTLLSREDEPTPTVYRPESPRGRLGPR